MYLFITFDYFVETTQQLSEPHLCVCVLNFMLLNRMAYLFIVEV